MTSEGDRSHRSKCHYQTGRDPDPPETSLALLPFSGADAARRFARERLNEQHPTDKPAPFKSATTAKRPYPSSRSAVAVLAIPRVGLSTIVFEGSDERELKLGPGHIRGTSLPGGGGNVAVAGHRDTFFRPTPLSRPANSRSIAARMNALLHEKQPCLVAASIRLFNSAS
jgi:hypothetical protein